MYSLKKERDSAREQTKNSLIETDRWYNQAMKLSSINKELESRITTLSIQINTIQESMKVFNHSSSHSSTTDVPTKAVNNCNCCARH